ncbi:hypothetical protein NFI96_007973 [Prochilodus magdalenae]|nr:hypothetical protein NFI96_007973 [Prochilodus magdalenae]
MGARGLKRKLHECEEGGGSVWENQLQSVLDISWDKFQRDQALVEPSLRRSVLINNTLRQVQSEVRTSLSGLCSPRKQHSPLRAQHELRSQRECSPADLDASVFSVGMEDTGDDFMAWSTDEDFSLSSAISAILKNLDSALDAGPSVPQRFPLASVENIPGDGKCRQSVTFSHMVESCRASEVGGSSMSGFLQDATIDDLLLDIDTSGFDGDVSGFGSRTFSFPADELVRYLPALSSSPSAPSSPGSREMHELEHIMDILVRS